jgi:PAS domain S-box-containing protein
MSRQPHASNHKRALSPDEGMPGGDRSDAEWIAHLEAELESLRRENASLRRADKKHTEIHEALAYQARLISCIHDAIIGTDTAFRITLWNPAAERLYGWTAEEVMGQPVQEIIRSDISPEQLADALRALQEKGECRLEVRQHRRDGTPVDVEGLTITLPGDGGSPTGFLALNRDITERRRAEETLAGNRQYIQAIVQGSPVPTFVMERDHTISIWNQAMEEYTGVKEDEMVGRAMAWKAFYPKKRPVLADLIIDHAIDQIPHWYESRCIPSTLIPNAYEGTDYFPQFKGGRWMFFTAAPIYDESREIVGAVEILQDVTERKQAEEALQSERNQLITILDGLEESVYISDPKTFEILYVNPHLSAVSGKDVVGGICYREFQGRESPCEFCTNAIILSQKPEPYRWEFYNPIIGRYFDITDRIIRWPDKRCVRLEVAVDITERKRMEEALQRSEEKYRHLVERAPDAILIHRDGRIWYVNPEGMRLLGVSHPDDLVGQEILSIVPPAYQHQILANIREDLEEGASPPIELPVLRLDGRLVWVEGRGTRTYIEDKPAVQVFLRDITERKRAERELAVYAENLKRSNEDLQRFAYVSSHDLQEPVRMITSYAQLLSRRYKGKLDADADEFIGFIEQGGKRMHELINDLLEYSRVTTRQQLLVPTDTEAVLADVLENLQLSIKEEGAAITHDPLPHVKGDAVQLRMVFQNLISNAMKFRKPDIPPKIHISAETDGRMVQFSISDNGIGIEPQYCDRIFVIFQRLHARDAFPGTGIGLAIVKRIVERHGGEIWVESQLDEGSTFYFTLPAVRGRPSREDPRT